MHKLLSKMHSDEIRMVLIQVGVRVACDCLEAVMLTVVQLHMGAPNLLPMT